MYEMSIPNLIARILTDTGIILLYEPFRGLEAIKVMAIKMAGRLTLVLPTKSGSPHYPVMLWIRL